MSTHEHGINKHPRTKSFMERSNFLNNGLIFFKNKSFEPLPFMDSSLFEETYGKFYLEIFHNLMQTL
jgi:hypothetical protein